ncbi:MAG: elongation factor G [Candidatus Hydrogenedentes bacterium]|nr:elongation factor G [Candidatus Hydrogenedentota bacterium]
MALDGAKVRNVGILGHGGTGKTTLIEHVLHAAGKTSRMGRVQDGNTVCDYLEEEIQRKQTISMKLAHADWDGIRIHMVDHPGYADFLGEVAASAPVLDNIIVMVDATTGMQVGTDNAMAFADRYETPRAIFVNKLDRENANFESVVEALRKTYGNRCVPLVIPIGQGESLKGAVNILTGDTTAVAGEVAELKSAMTDVVAESDDALLEKFLETGELTHEEFDQGLHNGIKSGKIVPIIAGSVDKDVGVRELLDVISHAFPTPFERTVFVRNGTGGDIELKISPDSPFVGQVFRSVVDPYVGQLTLFRVFTGTLRSDSDFYNCTSQSKERTGKLFLMNGKEQKQVDTVGPGDLAAMTKLKHTHFGDTIAAPGTDVKLPKIELPESMVKLAIVPKSRADEDKIGEALNRLAEEDPTFSHYRDASTHEHIVRGMGDLQLDILLERMKRKFHIEASTRPPKVALKETVKGKSEVQGKHKKQSGGHGQYGDVHLRISPNGRGEGYKFVDSVVGGVVPKNFIPAVDKGSVESLERGVIAGYPVVDIVVDLFYGSYHDVDSSEMAFKIAASMAIQKGVREARPCLLEPIMQIEITVPDDNMGDVNGDLNSRRGRILGLESAGPGRQRIRAMVPEAEVLTYSTTLRSMTGGRGSYSLKFDHYDEVPDHVAQPIIADYEKKRAAGEAAH